MVTFHTRWHQVFIELDEKWADASWSRSGGLTLPLEHVGSDLGMSGSNYVLLSAPLAHGRVGKCFMVQQCRQNSQGLEIWVNNGVIQRKWRNRMASP